jgi:hypothetical protein
MNCYVLLLIQAPGTEQFIEVGLDYDLPFHPNLTDEIEVAGFPCEIKEIYYNLDNLNYITMRVEAVDNLICMEDNPSKKYIHRWLMNEWEELKEWAKSDNERIILNDYLHHPEKDIEE